MSMNERVLDRIPFFDPRSRSFQIRPLLAVEVTPRGYTWGCNWWLDQGREGACVGFSWTQELGAKPAVVTISNLLAQQVYQGARAIDQAEGRYWSEGASILAGAKEILRRKHIGEYRWIGAGSGKALDDLILTVGYKGPVVLGINWYTGMFSPDVDGFINPSGVIEGGHAILCRGVSVKSRKFLVHNSWGKDWGSNGTAYISYDSMFQLLNEQGEGCVPLKRSTTK